MLLGDVGDTDIHKQHNVAMMEMRACLHMTRSQCIGRNNYNKSIRLSPLNPC